jgi:hypothetical protein
MVGTMREGVDGKTRAVRDKEFEVGEARRMDDEWQR